MTDFEYYLKLYKSGVPAGTIRDLSLENAGLTQIMSARQRAWNANDSRTLLACDRLVYSSEPTSAMYFHRWSNDET